MEKDFCTTNQGQWSRTDKGLESEYFCVEHLALTRELFYMTLSLILWEQVISKSAKVYLLGPVLFHEHRKQVGC